jgi:hypothetical protein
MNTHGRTYAQTGIGWLAAIGSTLALSTLACMYAFASSVALL